MKKVPKQKRSGPLKGLFTALLMLTAFAGFAVPVTINLFYHDGVTPITTGGTAGYYNGSWNTLSLTSGTTVADLPEGSYQFSMNFSNATQQTDWITVSSAGPNVINFQTTLVTTCLKNHSGAGLSGGASQYYASGNWHPIGTTDGTGTNVKIELLPGSYQFSMNYASATQQTDWTAITAGVGGLQSVPFKTTLVTTSLKNHTGAAGLSGGTSQYYASGNWHDIGTTNATGINANMELLPGSYQFSMNYASARQETDWTAITAGVDGQQCVPFKTTLVTTSLKNHGGITGLSGGTAQYYASGNWHPIGITDATGTNAQAELLPGSYQFSMNYNNATQQTDWTAITTGIGGQQTVPFQTTFVRATLVSHNGIAGLAGGTAQYYASGTWHSLGSTDASGYSNGAELMSGNYLFSMTYNNGGQQTDWTTVTAVGGDQNIPFKTTLVTTGLKDHTGSAGLAGGAAQYYASGNWYPVGTTDGTGANAHIELLPGNYLFSMTYNFATQQTDWTTVTSATAQTVPFQTTKACANLKNCAGALIASPSAAAQFYASGDWHNFPAITGGTTSAELLPGNYLFNMTFNNYTLQKDWTGVAGAVQSVDFTTTKVTFSNPNASVVSYYASGNWYTFTQPCMQMLPGNYLFQSTAGGPATDWTTISGCDKTFYIAPCTGPTGITNPADAGNHLSCGASSFLTGPAGAASYLWTIPSTPTSSATTQSIIANTSGTYTLAYRYDFTCTGAAGTLTTATLPVTSTNTRTVTVRLQDSKGNGIPNGTVTFYSGTWQAFGTTDAYGNVCKTFAVSASYPANFAPSIKVTYNGGSQQWNSVAVNGNPVQIATTTEVHVNLRDHNGNLTADASGTVSYYPGVWTAVGNTATGTQVLQLLPGAYSFQMNYRTMTKQMLSYSIIAAATQDVDFKTTLASLNVKDCSGNVLTSPAGTVDYDGGVLWAMGVPVIGGRAPIELLPGSYSFAMHYNNGRQQVSAPVGAGPLDSVDFKATKVTFSNPNPSAITYYQSAWNPFANPSYMLPGAYTFHTTAAASNTTINVSGCDTTFYISPTGTLAITSSAVSTCGGANTLTAPAGAKSYLWTPGGATTRSITATANGIYSVTVAYDYAATGAPAGSPTTYHTTVTTAANTVTIRLIDHLGTPISGQQVQYYSNGWNTFGAGTTDANGYACQSFAPGFSGSFQVIYAGGGSKQWDAAAAGNPVLVAQTTGVSVYLKDHSGNGINGAVSQYYSNGFLPVGTTAGNGSIQKEMLAGTYTFNMAYNDATIQKDVAIAGTTQEVDFNTTLVNVRVQDHDNNGLSGGIARFYSNGFHPAGTTDANGNAPVELLPGSYAFNMSYNNTSQELTYVIGNGPTQNASFTTTTITASVQDHLGNSLSGGVANYYNNGWYLLGTTGGNSGATPSVELLPGSYQVSMSYNFGAQQVGFTVNGGSYNAAFQTTTVNASLNDHLGNAITGGFAQFYNNGWHPIGTTDGSGIASTELMPGSYPFSMDYNFGSQQVSYDVAGSATSAAFHTTTVSASLTGGAGNPLISGIAQFYNNGWHPLGTTNASGNATAEMMPGSYPFSMDYNFGSQQISSAVVGNTTSVPFQSSTVTVSLNNHSGAGLDGGFAQFYNNGWHPVGTTAGGVATAEMMPGSYQFNMTYNNATQQLGGAVSGTASAVSFQTALVNISVLNNGTPVPGAVVNYYSNGWVAFNNVTDVNGNSSMEMLPVGLSYNSSPDGLSSIQVGPFTDAAGTDGSLLTNEGPGYHIIQTLSDGPDNHGADGIRHSAPATGPSTTVAAAEFGVFPNPATDKISIVFSSIAKGQASVRVADVSGKVIISTVANAQVGNNTHDLDLSSLPDGIYLLMFDNGNTSEVRKISVQH